jgi:arylsulfatase A-like enzyme
MNIDRTVLILLLALIATGLAAIIILGRRAGAEASLRHTGSSRSALSRFSEVLTIAVWFGLATGTIHVLLAVINRYIRNHLLMVGPQMFWMTPLSYALIFAVFGAVPAVLAGLQSRIEVRRRVVPVFAGLGVFSLLLPFPQLHKLAGGLIAAGVGLQVGRAMATRPDWWASVMRRTIVRGTIVLLIIGAVSEAWPRAVERYALSRLPAPPDKKPNVVLIVLDTVRAQSLSLYGYSRPTTPGLDQLAREGVTFDFAMSTSPWTLKSHGTMFSGLYAEEFEGDFERPVRFRTPFLAGELSQRGYVSGGFVANLPYTTRESGLARGFTHYDDYHLSVNQLYLHSWITHTPLVRNLAHSRSARDLWNAISRPQLDFDFNRFNAGTYGRRPANVITSAFLDWQAEQDRPFFAFLNYFDAHGPYRAPQDFQKRFALPERRLLGFYDAAIAYVDSEIQRLIEELRKRGQLDNTIVIITADHGEQIGDHGLNEHGNSLYKQLLHVPLLIRYPPVVPQGLRVTNVVTLRDLPATLAQLVGLGGAQFPGTSLAEYWSSARTTQGGSPVLAELSNVIRPDPATPAALGPMQSVFDEQFHYIRRGDGVEELYAYREDPAEVSDLSKTDVGRQRIPQLRRLLESAVSRSNSPR